MIIFKKMYQLFIIEITDHIVVYLASKNLLYTTL